MSKAPEKKNRVIVVADGNTDRTLSKAREVVYTYPKQGKISLVMRKAFNRMLQNAFSQGIEHEWYRLPVSLLARNIEFGSKDMSSLHETIDRMQTTLMKWQEINDEGKTVVQHSVQLIGAVKFVGDLRADGKRVQNFLLYKFDPDVKERIFNSTSRALIDLDVQNMFKSPHSAALYEHLMHTLGEADPDGEGWFWSPRLKWQEWRDLIMSSDTSTYYDNFKYFKRDVLRKVLAELEVVLDTYEIVAVTHRSGREISDLEFRIRSRAQSVLPLDNTLPLIDTSRIETALLEFGMNEEEIEAVLDFTDTEHIEAAIAYTRQRMAKTDAERLEYPDRYFIKALVGNFSGVDKSRGVAAMLKRAKSEKTPEPRGLRAPASATPVSKEQDAKRSTIEVGSRYFDALDPEHQRRLVDTWLNQEAKRAQKSAYAKTGLSSMVVKAAFFPWVASITEVP